MSQNDTMSQNVEMIERIEDMCKKLFWFVYCKSQINSHVHEND